MDIIEECIVVTESNKKEIEQAYTEGRITAVIFAKGALSNILIKLTDEFKERTPHFDFTIGDSVIKQ